MIFLVAFGLAIGIGVLYALLLAWPTMLLLGAVHSFLPWVPALGFWETILVLLLLRFLLPTSTKAEVE